MPDRPAGRFAPQRAAGTVIAVVALAVVAGCGGGGSGPVVRSGSPTSGGAGATSTPPATTATGSASSAGPTTGKAARQTITVSPATGLRDRQVVAVTASGFSPHEPLQLIQCADKGTKTGPGDCNLTGMLPVTADAKGAVSARLRVTRGPFGSNRIVCGAAQRCLVSVSQASLSPTEEADMVIRFAPQ